ncbi:hypothetical protein AAFF_G00249660 [Aldrovandia affinis]|uniref:Uncharacterized protein n=1 Tax=Aldrovandia affinis TaxID=143900 RepID=A0AAD7W3C6_9TELE|nr:hypothetical protein AAFF_G00249660 [Aldrovandia affinis]
MMCIYYITHMDGLQELWVKKMDIYLPHAHVIADALAVKYDVEAADLSSMLLSTYILTGCDTVSYLYRRGKKLAYKTAVDHLEDLLPLCRYGDPGESLDVKEDVVTAARQYMVSLYERSDFSGNLDALQAHLFGNIKGDMRYLPPTEDAFQLHLRRALHQLAVCKRAHMSQPTYPVATDFGRELVSDQREPVSTPSSSSSGVSVKLGLLNARSVKENTSVLSDFISNQDLDCFGITESWQVPGDFSALIELCPVGWKFHCTPRCGKTGGGVAFVYKDNYTCSISLEMLRDSQQSGKKRESKILCHFFTQPQSFIPDHKLCCIPSPTAIQDPSPAKCEEFLSFFCEKVINIRRNIPPPTQDLATTLGCASNLPSFDPISMSSLSEMASSLKPASSPLDPVPAPLLKEVFDTVGGAK